jgi:hypothetical protein
MAQQTHHIVETVQRAERRLRGRRQWREPQDRARDHAERTFAAHENLAQVVASVVLEHLVQRCQHGAIGQHDFNPEYLVAHHAVPNHAIAARIGGDIAADLTAAACAEIHRQQPSGRARGFLCRLQRGTRPDRHRASLLVDLFDATHPLEG